LGHKSRIWSILKILIFCDFFTYGQVLLNIAKNHNRRKFSKWIKHDFLWPKIRHFGLGLVGFWVWVLDQTQTPPKKKGLDSEFNSIHFAIRINKFLKFLDRKISDKFGTSSKNLPKKICVTDLWWWWLNAQKTKKKLFFVLSMINLNKFSLLVGSYLLKKSKKI